MKLSRNDKLFAGTILGLVFLFSAILFYHSTLRIERSLTTKPVGKVVFKNHVAMRKYSNRLVWEDVTSETPVYPDDSILTGDLSDAKLVIGDDFKLDIDANTLIVLAFKDNKLQLRLDSGAIRTSGKMRENTSIVTKSGQEIDISKAKTRVAVDKDRVQVVVNQGEASITNKKGEQIQIKQGAGAEITKQEISKTRFSLKAVSPPANQLYYTNKASQAVQLQWQGSQGAVKLILAQNPTFQNSRSYTTGESSKTVYLPPGQWYWQVQNQAGNENRLSQPASFKVFQIKPVRFLHPPPGLVLTGDDNQAITLRWSAPPELVSIRLQVAHDPAFKNMLIDTISSSSFYNMGALKPGKYHLRLLPQVPAGSRAELLPTSTSFSVVKNEQLKPVQLTTTNGLRIPYYRLVSDTQSFGWQTYAGARQYRVTIFRDAAGRYAISNRLVNNTSFVLERLAPGTYYWTVSAILNRVQGTPPAQFRSFTVLPAPVISLLQPGNGSKKGINPETRMVFLKFGWQTNRPVGQYRLQVSRSRSFTRLVLNQALAETGFVLPKLEKAGRYYWRVLALTANGKEILAKSPHRYFQILKFLARPGGLWPNEEGPVSLREKNSLTFRWGQVSGANSYLIRVYQKKQGGELDQILNKRIKQAEYTFENLPRFAEGKLFWEVSALNMQNGKLVTQGQTAEANCTISYGAPPGKPKIIPDNPVIEIQ